MEKELFFLVALLFQYRDLKIILHHAKCLYSMTQQLPMCTEQKQEKEGKKREKTRNELQ